MSASFSLLSWLTRLPLAASCIDGDGRYSDFQVREPRYYALAEDWKGSHCPYPKLPDWCQRVFDARVKVAYWFTNRHHSYWKPLIYDRMLDWHVPVMWRKRVMWRVNKLADRFECRRRGYSWHFHCSLCGGISFFDLARSRWACKHCGKLNPAVPVRRPRFSLLDIAQRWSKLCAKIDNRPEFVCCRFCGQSGYPESWNARVMRPNTILASTLQDISGRKEWHQYTCFRCQQAAQKVEEYLRHRDGSYLEGDVKRWMRHWLRTGQLPKAFEKHWRLVCPF